MQQCERGETDCFDGADDDLDTLIDCADPDCSCADAGGPEICDNGFDDDGDTLVDCADSECVGRACSGCGFAICICLGTTCTGMSTLDAGVM